MAGFIVGVLAWGTLNNFGLQVLPGIGGWADSPLSFWFAGLIGAGLITSRARGLLWLGSGIACLMLLGAISTPLVMAGARSLVRRDPLQHANAVYVLGGGIHEDGTPDDFFQERVTHAYELLGQGYAPVLVVPRLRVERMETAALPYAPFVRQQMHHLKLPQPVEEIGPVANTGEEAAGIARLARQHGWQRVIVVSSPTHMRRVAGVFRKAVKGQGVTILCSPCIEGHFDLNAPGGVVDRSEAFRTWIHEVIGYRVYKLRGRI